MPAILSSFGGWFQAQVADRSTLLGTLAVSLKSRSFYYTLLYSACIVVFGIARIRRRRTPYVTLQTTVLMLVQVIPLFLLPEIILPYLGYNGWFDQGLGKTIADHLFESYISAQQYAAQQWPDWGHPRAYWRAYGFILGVAAHGLQRLHRRAAHVVARHRVHPNVRHHPGADLALGQRRLLRLDLLVRRARRDDGRHAAPQNAARSVLESIEHGGPGRSSPSRSFSCSSGSPAGSGRSRSAASAFHLLLEGKNSGGHLVNYASYKWFVDVFLGGIIGVGLYFKYSGRVWCRFFCPLAALMHIYARFSRFRIFPEKNEVHLLQRLHLGLPSGHRRHELREQGSADGRSGMRALFRLRPAMPDRRARLWAL